MPSDRSNPDVENPSGEYRIAPAEGERLALMQGEPPAPQRWLPDEPPPTRFSLGELLLWVTLVSLAFGALKWLEPAAFAGVCSLVALGWWVMFCVWKPESRWLFVVWWALVAIYVMACVIAMVAPVKKT